LPEYIWILKDNNKETTVTGQSSITYQVKDTGKLEVNLIYGKNEFCTEAIQKTFTKSHIKANFFLDSIQHCNLPLQVFLNNISDSASKCSWYFSKKFISNLNNTTYSILQNDLPPRTYKQIYSHELESIYLPISLAVSNNDGCYDSITKKIAFTFPIARFMPDKISGCIPLTVSFSDSSHASGTIDKFIYKIGSDSVVTAAKNPVAYTFNKPGEFYVSEIIKSGNCYDTSYVVKIIAGEKLVPDISVSPSEICNGEKIRITGKSNNNNLVDQWYIKSIGLFYLNTPVPPDTSLTILADNIGDKDISLVLESNGCFSDTTIKAIFRIKGLSGNFIDTFSCTSPLNYEFRTQIGPAKTLIWKIDTATINNEDTVKYKFPSSGDFSVKITAFDNALCSLSISKIISVRQIKASFTLKD
jgi:PKD repeat protein